MKEQIHRRRINRRSRRNIIGHKARVLLACAAAPLVAMLEIPAEARVHLSSVAAGSASISERGSVTTIRTANNSILYFSQFNIAQGSTVNFIQPSAVSRVLDNITSAAPSHINGTLTSNGIVYLLDPAGIIFGPNSVVNVNHLIAAGASIADQDFLSGNDHFTNVTGAITSGGKISGNGVTLVGSQVTNTGSIVAPGGVVELISGPDVYLSDEGSHVSAKITTPATSSSGASTSAQGDNVAAMPFAAGDVYSLAIKHTGDIQASNVYINGGSGQAQISGTINASTPTTGGTVAITAAQVTLTGAQINASGPAGGGTVEIGGGPRGTGDLPHAQYVSLDSDTNINADATDNGTGGHVDLWSDVETDCAATLTARGGPEGGDGGYIETSGKILSMTGAALANAPHGKPGLWVIDPGNLNIVAGGNSTLEIDANQVASYLDFENVEISTEQDGNDSEAGTLTVSSPINVTASCVPTTLGLESDSDMTISAQITGAALSVQLDTLGANSNIRVNAPIDISGTFSSDGGNFSLNSGGSITASSVEINEHATFARVQNGDYPISIGGVDNQATLSANATVTQGSVTLSEPITAPAGVNIGGTSLTTNGAASISTTDTTFEIDSNGAVNLAGTIATNGAELESFGSSSFSSTATINTDGGEIFISSLGSITFGGSISTNGGPFFASGSSFENDSAISITSPNETYIIIEADAGDVNIKAPLSVSSSNSSSEIYISSDSGSVTINSGDPVTTTGSGDPAINIYADNNNITINAAVNSTGDFYGECNAFQLNSGGQLNALGASINLNTNDDDDGIEQNAVAQFSDVNGVTSYGSVSLAGPVVVGTDGFQTQGTTFTSTGTGTITSSGAVSINPSGAVSIGAGITAHNTTIDINYNPDPSPLPGGDVTISAPISTGGQPYASSGNSFTSLHGGTITTSGGSVTIDPNGPVAIGDVISTTGGAFTATGTGFSNTAQITDGSSTGAVPFFINTTSGTGQVTINGPITWSGGAGSSVIIQGGSDVMLDAAGALQLTGSIPVELDTTGALPATITVNSVINTPATFVADGGNFVLGSTGSIKATSIAINTTSLTPTGGHAVTAGSVTLSGPVTTTAGNFTADGTAFTSNDGAIISTTAGNVVIDTTGAVTIGANVLTNGGTFSAIGTGFQNNSSITNGASAPANATFTVNTTSGINPIVINAPITWSGGAGSKILIEGGGSVTMNPSDPLTLTGAVPVEIDTVGPTGVVTLGSAINTPSTFTADGGTFVLAATASITASSVAINSTPRTATSNQAVTLGTDTLSGPVTATGGTFTAGGTGFQNNAVITDGSGAPANAVFTINTTAGNGPIVINGPITWSGNTGSKMIIEGGSNVTLNAGDAIALTGAIPIEIDTIGTNSTVTLASAINTTSTFTEDGGSLVVAATGSISATSVAINTTARTVAGNQAVTIGSVTLSGPVTATGGTFTADGTGFQNNAAITDGAGAPVNAVLTINTTAGNGPIVINGPITWSGNAGSKILIEGGSNVTLESTGTLALTGPIPIEIDTVGPAGVITIDTAINTPSTFTTDGGSLVVTATGSIKASSVAINTTARTVGGNQAVTFGSVSLSGPVTTPGNFTADGTAFTSLGLGAVNVTTLAGNVVIDTTGADSVGAPITTDGGIITAVGTSFTNTAAISNGAIAPANATLTIDTVSGNGPVTINGPIAWAGAAGSKILIEGGAGITLMPAGRISTVGVIPIEIDTVGPGGSVISIESAVTTTSSFTADGGSFDLGPTGSITAVLVSLNTTPRTVASNLAVTLGSVTLSGPVVTTYGNFASGGTAFTSNGGGTIATHTGNVSIQSTGPISVGATVTTNGGAFVADGTSFGNSAAISDGGVNDVTAPGFSVTTTQGNIQIDGNITWNASSTPVSLFPASGAAVLLDANIIASKSEAVELDNGPVILTGPDPNVTVAGGNINVGTMSSSWLGGYPGITLESGGNVVLQNSGTPSNPIGDLKVTYYPFVPYTLPATILDGNIYAEGNVSFAGSVTLDASTPGVTVQTFGSDPTETYGGTVEGPDGLTATVPGNVGDRITFNGNMGDKSTLAFLDLNLGPNGIAYFSYGAGPLPPTPLTPQQPTTIDIASGGTVKFNYVTNDNNPVRPYPTPYASIGSYGSLTINIGNSSSPNTANTFFMGRNEKLTTYGKLTINTNGGSATVGDLNADGDLNLFSATVVFLERQPTVSTMPIDTGLDFVANGNFSMATNMKIILDKEGTDSFSSPAFIAETFSQGTVMARLSSTTMATFGESPELTPYAFFGYGDNLLDLSGTTVSTSLPTLIAPISFVFDLPIAGAVPRDDLIAGAVPRDLRRVRRQVIITPSLKDQLNQAEIFPRDPRTTELVDAVRAYANYNDVPQTPDPTAEDYKVVVNRLNYENAQRFIDDYFGAFRGEPGSNLPGGSRAVQFRNDIEKAWKAYTHNDTKQGTGEGFQQYCAHTPSAENAYHVLQRLSNLMVELDSLGLSDEEERNAARLKIFSGLSARSMQEGDLEAAVAAMPTNQ